MTVPQLIATVLCRIHVQFYDTDMHAFKRDERALTKAICRYGYECHQRGWEFDSAAILREISGLLVHVRERKADIKYLPVYLDGAIGRHIGQRAEELSAAAKSVPKSVARIVQSTRAVEVIREPSAVEILSTVYRDLRNHQRTSKQRPKPTKVTPTLF